MFCLQGASVLTVTMQVSNLVVICSVTLIQLCLHPFLSAFEPWRKLGMRCALVADQYTDISTRNPEGSTSLDALWMGSNIQRLFTGMK